VSAPRRPRVAIVDMAVAANSPAGSCVLAEIEGLIDSFDVTVFSDRCEASGLPGVEFVRVRAPAGPVLLRYLVFHLHVALRYLAWRICGGHADAVQATQGQLPGAAICYAHFCHRSYLRHQWRNGAGSGLRRLSRSAVHRFNAACEALAMRRARWIVVPSRGLAREIAADYPTQRAKLRVIANPVDVEHFARPSQHQRDAMRRAQGFDARHIVVGFMALGDFERKGLGLLLQALATLGEAERGALRLLVIGGQPGEIATYEGLARRLGVDGGVRFVGLQRDVRPFLWSCDSFALPSTYETFGLAAAQAAAAGLPVLVCDAVHGLEEFVADGRNGWSVPRTCAALAACLTHQVAHHELLPTMGRAAAETMEAYARPVFQARWADTIGAVLRGESPQHRLEPA
jgi:glycosyltransferase involved in cell wall biosynthesis